METSKYFYNMKGYADMMTTISQPLTDEEVIGYILASLPTEYDALMASLTVNNTAISLNDFNSQILNYKARQKLHYLIGDFTPSANSATCQIENGGALITPLVDVVDKEGPWLWFSLQWQQRPQKAQVPNM